MRYIVRRRASRVSNRRRLSNVPNLGTAQISRYACRDISRATPAPSTKPQKYLGTVYLGFSSLRFRFSRPVSGPPRDTQGGPSNKPVTIRRDTQACAALKPAALHLNLRLDKTPARPPCGNRQSGDWRSQSKTSNPHALQRQRPAEHWTHHYRDRAHLSAVPVIADAELDAVELGIVLPEIAVREVIPVQAEVPGFLLS